MVGEMGQTYKKATEKKCKHVHNDGYKEMAPSLRMAPR